MSVITEVEELALSLPVSDRGKLAEKLIRSLPSPGWDDDDDGIEEALRRDKEMDENPESVLTHEEFKAGLAEFRR